MQSPLDMDLCCKIIVGQCTDIWRRRELSSTLNLPTGSMPSLDEALDCDVEREVEESNHRMSVGYGIKRAKSQALPAPFAASQEEAGVPASTPSVYGSDLEA